jgi:acetyl esterase
MTLHPFFASVLEKNAGTPGLSSGAPGDARALVAAGRAALGAGRDPASVTELVLPTRGGHLSARLLIPHGEVSGVVVYLHGGGWVVGSVDDFDTLAREIAARSGCAVLLPEYRLAPEDPFPAALEDAEDAILWVAEHPGELSGAAPKMIVAGDSAGANLATVASRRLAGRVTVALEVLIYPVADSDFDTDSYHDASEGMPLTRADMRWFFGHYAPENLWRHEDVAPLRSDHLASLPPTLVITAEHDVLRSDGELYARRLSQAGVAATYRSYPGMVHGFLRLHNHVDVADQALDDLAAAIRRAVRNTATEPHLAAP